ncbi:MAG: polyprenyl synthetase family protein [Clostridia bacterium]|nr:polyprenyl synthetase family protein [Clostridia bacterium]
MKSFDVTYQKYYDFFNQYLKSTLDSLDKTAPKVLREAMEYAVVDGGKRVRPILCLATADMLGLDVDSVKEFALAIELIHSYSLVHDDLPSMDNDDYRRGKFSTHKKFGEANAILTGDALLNFAFEVCLFKDNPKITDIYAMRVIAEYAGYRGMIAGQVLDLENENNQNPTETILYDIQNNKCAKLITAPLLVPSAICDYKYFDELKEFGYHLGILFQMVDDIMDCEGTLEDIGKTPHKDDASDKLSSVKVFGLDGTKKRAEEHYLMCKHALSRIDNSEFLSQLADKLYKRKK